MKKLLIAKRGRCAPFSPIRKLTPLADAAEEAGKKIYHLNIGQPDLTVSKSVSKILSKMPSFDYIPYSDSQGSQCLLSAWRKYLNEINIKIETSEIVITSGASEALILCLAAIAEQGDEVLIFEPFYANYLGFANFVGVDVVPVALDQNSNYHLPPIEVIESAITNKTKVILLTNPNNPTGTVFSPKEIKLIISLAVKHGIFVISDETYFGFVFDNNTTKSFLQIASANEMQHIILVDSVSKRLNLCGARIGVIISKNSEFISAINRFAQGRLSVGFLDQLIAAPAVAETLKFLPKIRTIYENRRDIFLGTLEKGLGCSLARPEGAFYALIKLPICDTDDFARWLLTDFNYNGQTVMVAPGSGFYATSKKGKDEIRIAYVLNEKDLKQAAEILVIAIREYINITRK